MQTIDGQMLTVAEAAELLRVAPSTIRRWIREGEIQAYRVGKRRIGVRREDLSRVVVPANTAHMLGAASVSTPIVIPIPTEEERERGRAAVERLLERHRAYKAAGGEVSKTPAWVEINEARDERSEHLSRF